MTHQFVALSQVQGATPPEPIFSLTLQQWCAINGTIDTILRPGIGNEVCAKFFHYNNTKHAHEMQGEPVAWLHRIKARIDNTPMELLSYA